MAYSVGVTELSIITLFRNKKNTVTCLRITHAKPYISVDGGVSFEERLMKLPGGLPYQRENRGDGRGGQDRLYATPGKEGDLWLAAYDGLYHSTDEGRVFQKMVSVTQLHGFGFGRGAPGLDDAALYMIGIVNGVRGIFRSDDNAGGWTRINDDQHQWGLLLHVTGDPKRFGRVYVGTHGRGTMYGDPAR
jgi:hypothetical protein